MKPKRMGHPVLWLFGRQKQIPFGNEAKSLSRCCGGRRREPGSRRGKVKRVHAILALADADDGARSGQENLGETGAEDLAGKGVLVDAERDEVDAELARQAAELDSPGE